MGDKLSLKMRRQKKNQLRKDLKEDVSVIYDWETWGKRNSAMSLGIVYVQRSSVTLSKKTTG